MNVSGIKKVRILSGDIELDAFTRDNVSYYGIDGNPILNTKLVVVGTYKKPGFTPELKEEPNDLDMAS